ncbi:hypothetical protein [Chryseobacterium gregarium]|uniref:hypothetical protein n=1 Tax=Chryseobacterium gregarium TaxID=456299 RepID=UPI0003FEB1B6|nr:hypothetical protein [Chryseobacterium gregarium]
MKFLPFERLIYRTDLSEQELFRRLSDHVETKKFRIIRTHAMKEYEGHVNNDNTFEISRILRYRNSFQPEIEGTFQRSNHATQIEVKMRLNLFVSLFTIFWCSMAFLFFIVLISSDAEWSFETFIPLFMVFFAYLMVLAGFKAESRRSKKDLSKIFESRDRIDP